MYADTQAQIRGLIDANDLIGILQTTYSYHVELTAIKAAYEAYEADPGTATDEQTTTYAYTHGLFNGTGEIADIFDMITDTGGIATWNVDHADLLAVPAEE